MICLYDGNFKPLVIVWRPFRDVFRLFHQNWKVRTSLIDAFSTFFLLSNMKFLSTSFDLLTPVKVYQLNSTGHLSHSWRLYYDATVPYFGHAHLPYAVLGLVVLTLFVLLPSVLLILYPFCWFQRFLNLFPFRWYILHTFMDTFLGCYKDGTEPGTHDCRWFASVYFLGRLLAVAIGSLTLSSMLFSFFPMILTLIAILYIAIEPFKLNVADRSSVNAICILLLAIWFVCICGYNISMFKKPGLVTLFLLVAVLIALAGLLYVSVLILKWLYKQRKFGMIFLNRLYARRHGYDIIN